MPRARAYVAARSQSPASHAWYASAFDDRVERIGVLSLERGGDFAVQRDALAPEQLGVDRLARERVTEGEPFGRFLDDELRGDQLLDERQQLLLVVIGERSASSSKSKRRPATAAIDATARAGTVSAASRGAPPRRVRGTRTRSSGRARQPPAVADEVAGDDQRL